jgi:uncharacterized protein (DUF1778 family)
MHEKSPMARSAALNQSRLRRARGDRLGFRIDRETKDLVERAARLERRRLTDYCLSALAEAAEKTIARHETLSLSDRDRKAFFAALINPPRPKARLRRAFKSERRRIAP